MCTLVLLNEPQYKLWLLCFHCKNMYSLYLQAGIVSFPLSYLHVFSWKNIVWKPARLILSDLIMCPPTRQLCIVNSAAIWWLRKSCSVSMAWLALSSVWCNKPWAVQGGGSLIVWWGGGGESINPLPHIHTYADTPLHRLPFFSHHKLLHLCFFFPLISHVQH